MSSFTEGQTHQLMDALEKGGATAAEITKLGQSPSLIRSILDLVRGVKQVVTNQILRLLSAGTTITVRACTGLETLAQARDVFKSYIDSDFKNWGLDKAGEVTEEIVVQVYELVKNATFAQMLGSVGADLNKLCMTQHQIIAFCIQHSEWLRTDGYATFFLFKVEDQFFVARVRVRSGGLRVFVDRFEDGNEWLAEYRYRVVAPQLGPQ